jgi:hypothetical protein
MRHVVALLASGAADTLSVMTRGLLIWVLIMLVETGHGILRGLYLVPMVGEQAAGRIGWPAGTLIVLAITWFTIRWSGLSRTADLVRLGTIWAGLTFFFEVAIGLLRGLSWAQIGTEINPLGGGLMLYSLIVMLAAPWLGARLRGRKA